MAEPKKKDKNLFVGLGVGAALTGAGIYANKKVVDKMDKLDRESRAALRSKSSTKGKATQLKFQRKLHPKKVAAERARATNPIAYKSATKKQRLARRAAKASTRGLGAVGFAVNAPEIVGISKRVSKEGGSFPAKLGKITEQILGVPRGLIRRPRTDKEKKADLSI